MAVPNVVQFLISQSTITQSEVSDVVVTFSTLPTDGAMLQILQGGIILYSYNISIESPSTTGYCQILGRNLAPGVYDMKVLAADGSDAGIYTVPAQLTVTVTDSPWLTEFTDRIVSVLRADSRVVIPDTHIQKLADINLDKWSAGWPLMYVSSYIASIADVTSCKQEHTFVAYVIVALRDDSQVAGEDSPDHPSRVTVKYIDAAYKAIISNRRLNNGTDNFLNRVALPTILDPSKLDRIPGDMYKSRLVVTGKKIIKEDGT